MRRLHKVAAGMAAVIVGSAAFVPPGLAQVAATKGAAPREAACGPGTLGVSRTVEIATAGGPLFGHQQYKQHDFLDKGEVVLTFDDGPLRAYTMPVLQALDAQCAKATFFMVGKMAVADPDMAKEVARRGHTVGTHTWSHTYQLGRTNPIKAREEIELGLSAVQRALGEPVAPFFRFPFLSDSRSAIAHLGQRDLAAFSIDVDSLDYRNKGPGGAAEVVRRVMRDLEPRGKGIILFHDIQPSTARAMPELLAQLKAKGYRIVHIVPKGRATTLAEFDAIADRTLGRKQLAAAANPLARRSLTWQMSTDVQPSSAGPATRPAAITAYPASAPLPWQKPPAAGVVLPPPAAQPILPQPTFAEPPRPALRGTVRDDWRDTIFNSR